MQLIDSHCHLTFDGLHDRIDDVIRRAHDAGVTHFITIATDAADALRALALSQKHPCVYVAAGIHPHEAGKVAAGWDDALLQNARRNDIYAVGETGLDYHYDFADKNAQLAVFRRQLEIACQVNKPVVIHCREAHQDTMSALADFKGLPGCVFHCFTGDENEAGQILERGYWLSLTGVVTFKRSDELRRVAKMIPDDRLMVETDAPYLSPEPVRNIRPNEPANMPHTARCIAEQRRIDIEELAPLSVRNTRRFFSLPANELA